MSFKTYPSESGAQVIFSGMDGKDEVHEIECDNCNKKDEWKLEHERRLNEHIQELTDYLTHTHGITRSDILLYMKAWEIRFRKLLFAEEKKKSMLEG